jgi:hypothetical protein
MEKAVLVVDEILVIVDDGGLVARIPVTDSAWYWGYVASFRKKESG